MSRPTLSVCIPNYNMAQWVAGAIESALAQEPADLVEVVVVDNASTDVSREVLQRYRGIPRLRIDLAGSHLPMAENWNRAVRASRGEWCVLLCADDELLPEFTENLLPRIADGGDVVISEASLGLEGAPPRLVFALGDSEFTMYQGRTGLLDLLPGNPTHVQNPFPLSTTAFLRRAFDRVGGFRDPVAGLSSDWDLWFRLVSLDGARATSLGVNGGRYYLDRGSRWKRAMHDASDLKIIGDWLVELLPELRRAGLERETASRYARHAIYAIFSRNDPGRTEVVLSQLERVAPALRRLGVEREASRELARHAVYAALGRASVRDAEGAMAHLRAGMQRGSGAWRYRAAIEILLLASGVGFPLAAWRVSSQPRARALQVFRSALRRAGPAGTPVNSQRAESDRS